MPFCTEHTIILFNTFSRNWQRLWGLWDKTPQKQSFKTWSMKLMKMEMVQSNLMNFWLWCQKRYWKYSLFKTYCHFKWNVNQYILFFFPINYSYSYFEFKVKENESNDDIKEAFRVFDRDGDGFISAEELGQVRSYKKS